MPRHPVHSRWRRRGTGALFHMVLFCFSVSLCVIAIETQVDVQGHPHGGGGLMPLNVALLAGIAEVRGGAAQTEEAPMSHLRKPAEPGESQGWRRRIGKTRRVCY